MTSARSAAVADQEGWHHGMKWFAGLRPAASRRVTIVFTDIEGFTGHAATNGDGEALRLLARHDAAVLPLIRGYRGRVVKRLGDGLMLVFGSGPDALAAALRMQQAAGRDGTWRLRIGMHAGKVHLHDGDVIGHAVNVAARIAALAPGGVILASAATVRGGSARLRAAFRRAHALTITGAPSIGVFAVDVRSVAHESGSTLNAAGDLVGQRRDHEIVNDPLTTHHRERTTTQLRFNFSAADGHRAVARIGTLRA